VTETAEAVLAADLRARGGRLTPQRLAIARVVDELEGHLTAEDVHHELSRRCPGISMPTVYATLELLEELHQVTRVAAGLGAALFDLRTEPHDHMICTLCGRVEDLESAVDRSSALAAAGASGFVAEDAQLVVRGRCSACASSGSSKPR
jgi:Fe2+ or Zn2+ uptake regulation protein